MAAANLDLLEGEFSDGCGKLDRDGAEADADDSVGLLNVVDGRRRACAAGRWARAV
ncbi:hypothetical protein [Streptomyces sp. NPDC056308]|uniref:hypothetical protein n=1 Tax=Streptomyces sp. NPDC056308 TaxID=3345780 RepID=UPI0035D5CFE8